METILGLFHQGTSVIVPFVVLLGVLIFVHELGHFSVAKFFGIRVEVFSLGFGRKIFQKRFGDTTYCLSLIPFGGYVKMYGDDMTMEIPPDQQRFSFSHQPVLPRIAVVLAGPLMNAVFAIFLFTLISSIGEEVLNPKVGDVFTGTAASEMGFKTDDVVKSVNGTAVTKWEDVKKIIEDDSNSAPLKFDIERAGKEMAIDTTPTLIPNKNILSSKAFIGDIDGLSYLTRAAAVGVDDPTSAAALAGLKTGDIIHDVDGKEVWRWDELTREIKAAASAGKASVDFTVARGSDDAPTFHLKMNVAPKAPLGGLEPSDLFLSSVSPKSAAADAGIQVGDKLVSINGKVLNRWEDVTRTVQSYDGKGALKVQYVRGGRTLTADITPRMMKQTDGAGVEQQSYVFGIVTGLVYATPDTFVERQHGTQMFEKGVDEMSHWTALTALSFVRLAQGKVSSKSIGGPLMIGKLASDTWRIGISPFLKIMAIISINLFLLNLLPIPVLDGGHLLFFSIEFVKGSPLSFRKIEVLQQVGMFLLLALMVFSMFNDIVRFFSS